MYIYFGKRLKSTNKSVKMKEIYGANMCEK